jgi:hypothetical protein
MGVKLESLTLREKQRLRVFDNRVLRRIFGPKRDEVTVDLRKLHNEELHDLYCSLNIVRMTKSRRMKWARHVARMGEERCVYSSVSQTPGRGPVPGPGINYTGPQEVNIL